MFVEVVGAGEVLAGELPRRPKKPPDFEEVDVRPVVVVVVVGGGSVFLSLKRGMEGGGLLC